jgi:hypothetical protein
MPLRAQAGRWDVSVICLPGRYSAEASFTVGTPLKPAQVVVTKSGFSAESGDSGTLLTCGLVLENRSPDSDARDATVTVAFVDTLGRSVASDEFDLTLIPAGQTFYASCFAFPSVTISVASLNVRVIVGKSVPRKAQLPPVSGLAVTQDESGSTTLTGNLTNPYTRAMPEDATIYAVYFDASGNIVGGDEEGAGASVQPGATVGFQFDVFADNVANARVSVDPCGAFAFDCAVP